MFHFSFLVTLDYKALLLLDKKDDENLILGGKGYGKEFCVYCNTMTVNRSF